MFNQASQVNVYDKFYSLSQGKNFKVVYIAQIQFTFDNTKRLYIGPGILPFSQYYIHISDKSNFIPTF